MIWLAGLMLLATALGVVVLMAAVIRHGRRETEKAEEIMDEVALTLLRGRRAKDDGNDV